MTTRRGAPAGCAAVAVGAVVVALALAGGWVGRQLQPARPGDARRVLVSVPRGASVRQAGELLARRGLVRGPRSLLLAWKLGGAPDAPLKAGTYALSAGESPGQILRELQAGRQAMVTVTLPEGFTLRQVAERLRARGLVADAGAFERLARAGGRRFATADGFTPPPDLEGYLYPDTYDIAPGTAPGAILRQMVQRFDAAVVAPNPGVRDWRRPVIVASLIEREAGAPSDRPLIAAVLYNRLRLRMPLQIDATVEYALPAHKARLMDSDLRAPSPYNTYLRRGLPPGPICNPGAASIDAALHPARVDYLYYVAGPGGGASLFSRTLAGHERNIAAVRPPARPAS